MNKGEVEKLRVGRFGVGVGHDPGVAARTMRKAEATGATGAYRPNQASDLGAPMVRCATDDNERFLPLVSRRWPSSSQREEERK